MNPPSTIVGIGAPAGSETALCALVGALPADSGVAVVVLTASGADENLVRRLSRQTRLDVSRLGGGDTLRPDRVHVAPAGATLATGADGLWLVETAQAERDDRGAIDRFFGTLADRCGPKACAVVLSGADADGRRGARAVSAAGGCAFVPDDTGALRLLDGTDRAPEDDRPLAVEEVPARIARFLGDRAVASPAGRSNPRTPVGPNADGTAAARARADLENLLEATGLATLFLDSEDRLRIFTPEATVLFDLGPDDIGRPIADVTAHVAYPELLDDLRAVRGGAAPVTRELRLGDGERAFELRARPYRAAEGRTDGSVLTFLEITERKAQMRRIEADGRRLARQCAELETLYEKTPVGLSLVDRDTRWLRINEALAAINGLSVEAHVGKRAQDMAPGVVDVVKPIVDAVFETGEPRLGVVVSGETAARPGATREWLADYFPVRDESGIFAVGTVVREVTEQRALERRLIESEARMRRLFDQAPAMILITEGPDQRVIYANPPAEAAIGRDDAIGLTLDEAVPGMRSSGMLALFERVFATGEPRFTQEIRAQQGLERDGGDQPGYLRQIIQPWYDEDGSILGTMLFGFDISDAVRSRRAADDARDRLQKVQDSIDAFVGLLDLDGTLLEANRTAIERAGLTRADVIGRKFWDCHWWSHDPAEQARLRDAVERAAAGEAIHYDADIRLAGEDCARIAFQLVPRHDETGAVTELIPSGMDITERARAEERKTVLMAELQHRVKNVLATVQAIMRFTARKSADKDELLEKMQQRLAAIARTHDALTRESWSGRRLRDLIEEEVRPFTGVHTDRLVLNGPDILLEPAVALSLGLAVHELTTNAAKYGALSNDVGRITVTLWAEGERLVGLEWRETGGPPACSPAHEGFGTFLVTKVLGNELGATVDVRYLDTGLVCRVKVDDDGTGDA